MNRFIGFFTSEYEDKNYLIQKKAAYTAIFSLLIISLIFVIYIIKFVTEGFYFSVMIETIIVLICFLINFYFLKIGKLELSINILILLGFFRCVIIFQDKTVGQFYSTAMLVILTAAVVYVKRYQMILISIFFPVVYFLKLFSLRIELKERSIHVIEFNENLYVFFILLIYFTIVYFLINVINKEIQQSEELAKSKKEIYRYMRQLKEANKKLEKLASTDELTGVFNRRKFEEISNVEIEECETFGIKMVLIMIDIDYFKKINDKFGHKTGDKVLIEITKIVSNTIRKTDYFIRWGGEEFILLAFGTGINEGTELAEKLRKKIEKCSFEGVGKVTISIGVTEYKKGDNIDKMILRADSALYKAKEKGRNRVEKK